MSPGLKVDLCRSKCDVGAHSSWSFSQIAGSFSFQLELFQIESSFDACGPWVIYFDLAFVPFLKMKSIRSLLVLALTVLAAAHVVQAGSNAESKAWLEENAKKDDVVVLPSGLQYKVLKKGEGTDHPTVDSPCSCHYKGTLIDGTQFDSSYDRGEVRIYFLSLLRFQL